MDTQKHLKASLYTLSCLSVYVRFTVHTYRTKCILYIRSIYIYIIEMTTKEILVATIKEWIQNDNEIKELQRDRKSVV